jgi:hypothetical protein
MSCRPHQKQTSLVETNKKVKKELYICVKLEEIKQQFICAANVELQ